ncbi:fructokinase-like 2, chloroplastic [Asparagus officinalis]|nr:fructokinase-like 2, chloroplastic [Asparagus officinalis]
MACLPISFSLLSLRGRSSYCSVNPSTSVIRLKNLRLQKIYIQAVSKKSASRGNSEDASNEESASIAPKKTRAPRRSRKKSNVEISEETGAEIISSLEKEEESTATTSDEGPKKVTRRGRRKATTSASSMEEVTEKKTTRRRTRKKADPKKEKGVNGESGDFEESTSSSDLENEMEELRLREDELEDISFTYSWPPLVCCFGAAQHAFIPSGRPANRLIDHEIHESKKDMFWSPSKFVRAPGGSSSNVAIALACLGGRVAFMGKLGDDQYGQNFLYHLNVNNVQTRSVVIDTLRPTAVSRMKITKRGGLRTSCVKPCAEDSLVSSEINIDILREAKMFYFNSSSLIDQNMRSTTMQAIKASKKLGGVIFFDLNLPLPLWESNEDSKKFIQQAWESADFIEVTKQELEFLCGIKPIEKFDTKHNDRSKFVHYKPEVIQPLWHENLKVLFVTNGTSKIHYYTEKDNGWVHGMEDAPITPFTGDMSISGDAIVAALMRMLTVQPHLATDKGYLEHMIKYAIDCGVIDQWLLARVRGFPPKEEIEESSPSEFRELRSITEKEYRTVEEHSVEELVS